MSWGFEQSPDFILKDQGRPNLLLRSAKSCGRAAPEAKVGLQVPERAVPLPTKGKANPTHLRVWV